MKGKLFRLTGSILALLCLLPGCELSDKTTPIPRQKEASYKGTIVAVGDSLTAGLGVSDEEVYPARLEKLLHEAGYKWKVVNAGISGETSSGTLSRISWILKLKPDIVILETGANDGMRGIDPGITKKNIDETIRLLKDSNVMVVLAGMKMLTNLGPDFTRTFGAMYPALARKHELIFIPFFLKGVAGDPLLNQSDGIHPTAEGYRIIAKTVFPSAKEAIDRKQKR